MSHSTTHYDSKSRTRSEPVAGAPVVRTGLSREPPRVPFAGERQPLSGRAVGECAIFAQLWPFLMLLPTLVFVNGVVVPFEEAQLRAAFADRYCDYCATVRRWL